MVRILTHFFQIFKIPLVSTPKVHEKGRHFYYLGARTAVHSYGRKNCATSHGLLGYLQAEFYNSEKSDRIMRFPGFWHFFGLAKFRY
jgi:hypothetical protein